MKNKILPFTITLVLIFITHSSASAQFSVNIMGGAYSPGLSYSSDLNNTPIVSISLEKEILNGIALESGITYFSIVIKEDYYFWSYDWTETWYLHHFRLPLLIKFKILNKSFYNSYIYAGPSVDWFFHVNSKKEGDDFSWGEDLNDDKFYFNLETGAGIEIKISSKLQLTARIGAIIPYESEIRTTYHRGDVVENRPLKRTISFQYLFGIKISL